MRNRLTAEGAMIRGHPPGLAEIEKFVCSLDCIYLNSWTELFFKV